MSCIFSPSITNFHQFSTEDTTFSSYYNSTACKVIVRNQIVSALPLQPPIFKESFLVWPWKYTWELMLLSRSCSKSEFLFPPHSWKIKYLTTFKLQEYKQISTGENVTDLWGQGYCSVCLASPFSAPALANIRCLIFPHGGCASRQGCMNFPMNECSSNFWVQFAPMKNRSSWMFIQILGISI